MAIYTCLRYRGQRLVTCPETLKDAAVHVKVFDAARKASIGKGGIRLDQCLRWPERQNCGQECLSQVQSDPEHCLVWNIVSDWYRRKSCAYCQKPFLEPHWHDRHPARLAPDRTVKQWNEIPAERLHEVFETHLPVCWNCYIADHPELVLGRQWDRGAGGEYAPKEEIVRERRRGRITPEEAAWRPLTSCNERLPAHSIHTLHSLVCLAKW